MSKSHLNYYEIKTDACQTRIKTIKKRIEIYQGLLRNQHKVGNMYKTQDKSLSRGDPSNKISITFYGSEAVFLIKKYFIYKNRWLALCSLFAQGEGCEITEGGRDKGRVVSRDGQR